MKKVEYTVQVAKENGIVTNIGKSNVPVPEVKWNGKGIKWFDDSQLLKKNK